MKYIDADKLRSEIEDRRDICSGVFERNSDTYYQGKAVAYNEVLFFLDTLEESEQTPADWSEEQIVNATFNDLAIVYERIRAEMIRRHRDIAINIKEGQR